MYRSVHAFFSWPTKAYRKGVDKMDERAETLKPFIVMIVTYTWVLAEKMAIICYTIQ